MRLTGFVCISAYSRNKGCAVEDAGARQSPGLSEWIFQILPVKLRQQPPLLGHPCTGGIRVPRSRPDRSPAQRVRSGKEEQRSERTGGAKKRRRKRYGACDDVVRVAGLSRGLKNMPPACFLRLRRRPVQVPQHKYGNQTEGGTKCLLLFGPGCGT